MEENIYIKTEFLDIDTENLIKECESKKDDVFIVAYENRNTSGAGYVFYDETSTLVFAEFDEDCEGEIYSLCPLKYITPGTKWCVGSLQSGEMSFRSGVKMTVESIMAAMV